MFEWTPDPGPFPAVGLPPPTELWLGLDPSPFVGFRDAGLDFSPGLPEALPGITLGAEPCEGSEAAG